MSHEFRCLEAYLGILDRVFCFTDLYRKSYCLGDIVLAMSDLTR